MREKERLIPGLGIQAVTHFACVTLKMLPRPRASALEPKMGL